MFKVLVNGVDIGIMSITPKGSNYSLSALFLSLTSPRPSAAKVVPINSTIPERELVPNFAAEILQKPKIYSPDASPRTVTDGLKSPRASILSPRVSVPGLLDRLGPMFSLGVNRPESKYRVHPGECVESRPTSSSSRSGVEKGGDPVWNPGDKDPFLQVDYDYDSDSDISSVSSSRYHTEVAPEGRSVFPGLLEALNGHSITPVRVHQRLGAGDYGTAYVSGPIGSEEIRACAKFFNLDGPKDRAQVVGKVVKELGFLKRLQGVPGIVQPTGDGLVVRSANTDLRTAKEVGFEMELGSDVLSKKMPTTPDEVLALGNSVFVMLDSLKTANVVHRDVKPDNIFIVNGEFKLGDFGISADANGPSQISLGTPEYKAPEDQGVYQEHSVPSHKADVFSFGLILAEALFNLPSDAPKTDGHKTVIFDSGKKDSRFPAISAERIRKAVFETYGIGENEVFFSRACTKLDAVAFQHPELKVFVETVKSMINRDPEVRDYSGLQQRPSEDQCGH